MSLRVCVSVVLLVVISEVAEAAQSPATEPASIAPPVTDTTDPWSDRHGPHDFEPTEHDVFGGTGVLDARLAVLEQRRSYADTWFYGWTAAYAVGTVAQGALYYAVDEDEKPGYLVGTATAALAVGGMIISPVKTGSVADRFRALRAAGNWSEAETLFEATADGEREARNWFNHGLSAAVGLGSGAILLFHYDQPGAAIFQTVSSLVIGELQILTGPTAAADARDQWATRVSLGAGPDRVVVAYRF